MAKVVGIIGKTGRGKTMSVIVPPDGTIKKDKYEGLNLNETVIFNLDGKEPTFKVYDKLPEYSKVFGDFFEKKVLSPNFKNFIFQLTSVIENKPEIKNIIIDTFSFGMFRERMKKERIKGFEKWTELGVKFWELIEQLIQKNTRDDLMIYIFFHIDEYTNKNGDIEYRAKVEGNMLKDKPEESLNHMFFATKYDKEYVFETQSNGTTAKNPPLLFNETIPNSLKLIRDTLIDGKLYIKQ